MTPEEKAVLETALKLGVVGVEGYNPGYNPYPDFEAALCAYRKSLGPKIVLYPADDIESLKRRVTSLETAIKGWRWTP